MSPGRGTGPALLDGHQYRRRNVDRGEGPGEHTKQHYQREGPDHLAPEERQRDKAGHGGTVGKDAPGKSFVDRAVQDLGKSLVLVLVEILPDPVEDDDGVIQ